MKIIIWPSVLDSDLWLLFSKIAFDYFLRNVIIAYHLNIVH